MLTARKNPGERPARPLSLVSPGPSSSGSVLLFLLPPTLWRAPALSASDPEVIVKPPCPRCIRTLGERGSGMTYAGGIRHAEGLPDASAPVGGVGDAERVPGRVEQYPPGLARLRLGERGTEPDQPLGLGIDVVGGQVEVELLAAVLVGPARRFVVLDLAEPESRAVLRLEHGVVLPVAGHLLVAERGLPEVG